MPDTSPKLPASGPNQWVELPATDVGDAIVGAMVEGGVDHLFFTSGGEIGFIRN